MSALAVTSTTTPSFSPLRSMDTRQNREKRSFENDEKAPRTCGYLPKQQSKTRLEIATGLFTAARETTQLQSSLTRELSDRTNELLASKLRDVLSKRQDECFMADPSYRGIDVPFNDSTSASDREIIQFVTKFLKGYLEEYSSLKDATLLDRHLVNLGHSVCFVMLPSMSNPRQIAIDSERRLEAEDRR